MKTRITGSALVVESDINYEELAKITKLKKDLTIILDETGEEIYKLAVGSSGNLSKYGAVFTDKTVDGNATLTVLLPEGLAPEGKGKYVTETYFEALDNLKKAEKEIIKNIKTFNKNLADIEGSIEIV